MTGLRTDLYELRMAASYLRRGMIQPATFSLFVRRLPRRRGFLVAAGLAEALDFLERFGFTDDELGYLREVVGLDQPTLDVLAGMRFTGDVWAVPEGRARRPASGERRPGGRGAGRPPPFRGRSRLAAGGGAAAGRSSGVRRHGQPGAGRTS